MRIRNITIDCGDPYPLAAFWTKITDFQEDPGNRNEPDDPEGLLLGPTGGPNLLFIQVHEPTGGAGRLRLDLTPTERTRDEEVDRLLKLGATLVADHRGADGAAWVLLDDPEGNEFSVARRAAEAGTEARRSAVVPAAAPPPQVPKRATACWRGWVSWRRAAATMRGGRHPWLDGSPAACVRGLASWSGWFSWWWRHRSRCA